MHAPSIKLSLLAALASSAAMLGGIGTAAADATTTQTASQVVAGTTVSTVSISIPTPAALTNVTPGSTATGTGALTLVSTGNWTLGVADSNATPATTGHPLAATGATCTNSESYLKNAMTVASAGTLGTVNSSGTVTLGASSQQVASGTGSASVANTYNDVIGSSEVLITGCAYSLTATYTLQSS